METPPLTVTIGYPRIGPNREMKRVLENYWSRKATLEELLETYQQVARASVRDQMEKGVDIMGVGGHTLYDHVLDWLFRLGLVAERFESLQQKWGLNREDLYFAMARGKDEVMALDMTKWFDTNYHNITPEINQSVLADVANKANFTDYLSLLKDACALAGSKRIGAEVMGPLTMAYKSALEGVSVQEVVEALTPVYVALFQKIKVLEVAEIQLHEPALVMEVFHTATYHKIYQKVIHELTAVGVPINLITYYDDLGAGYPWVVHLEGISAVSMDFTRGKNLELLKQYGFPAEKRLGLGVIDGRSVWEEVETTQQIIATIHKHLSANTQYAIQPSCSLMHVPLDTALETTIPTKIMKHLRFAKQKLDDLRIVAHNCTKEWYLTIGESHNDAFKVADTDIPLADTLFTRGTPVKQRRPLQLLPLKDVKLVTSTIGSFPQMTEMRKIRLQYRKGEVDERTYFERVDDYIRRCIEVQESVGLDILVHGEPERSDMVEYFAEKLDGFIFTMNGWVQSYGSRYTRPPIINDTVKRNGDKAMTVREYRVASGCTEKFVKGMLTGPVTILNWSFPRKDISRKTQCYQIAMALRDEVVDLEAAGCKVIQVDEPALREGLPLRSSNYEAYLSWAIKAFRLSTSVVKPETHIVTHFCYSEFGDVMSAIKGMDADQITIENSRSNNAMLKELVANGFENIVAPGVYDVHSPVVPSVDILENRIRYFLESGVPADSMFVVPDCGLKTRKWEEVTESLRNVVLAVKRVRADLK